MSYLGLLVARRPTYIPNFTNLSVINLTKQVLFAKDAPMESGTIGIKVGYG